MFSKNVFKQTLKQNWKLWAIITGILMFFMFIFVVLAGGSMADMGGEGVQAGTSTISLIGTMLYGSIGFLLCMVYVLVTGNSLIASQVDRGSMAHTLSTPTSRKEVTLTQIIYFVGAICLMWILIMLTCIVGFAIAGLEIATTEIVLLTLGMILLQLAIAGISFMFSCIFNTTGKSITFGTGIPVLFYIFSLVGAAGSAYSDFFKLFKYLSINTLYNTSDILSLSYSSIIPCFIALAVITIATFSIGHFVFKKKDLPL